MAQIAVILLFLFSPLIAFAQFNKGTVWAKDGYRYYNIVDGSIVESDVRSAANRTIIASKSALAPMGHTPVRFAITEDGSKLLINCNTKKVWRYDTRGDYWVYDVVKKTLKQIGKNRPAASLMFAKFSPDGNKVAYVSEHNIFVEDLTAGTAIALTTDGTNTLINGTFDWAYEEEFGMRDGFRWSPDGQKIAYWQIDAGNIKKYLMMNMTDSVYSYTIPVEYPTAGHDPSSCRIGIVKVSGGSTQWMDVPGDKVQHYITLMQWTTNSSQVLLQQLNRAQNQSKLILARADNGSTRAIFTETDKAWVDTKQNMAGITWINDGKEFVWSSEQDGWRHLYRIDLNGRYKLITRDAFDAFSVSHIDGTSGVIYFIASPANATQRYLYKVKLIGGRAERVTPMELAGTHEYVISPNGKLAMHRFSNVNTRPQREIISLPSHGHLSGDVISLNEDIVGPVELFKVKTADGVEMDGWMKKPDNFDPQKKYPVVFFVYGEYVKQTVLDTFGVHKNKYYAGDMAADGYIHISIDNRGIPAPKGRSWRKAIYKNIGLLNIRDQAMAAKEVLKWPFIDSSRVAVWGVSGGGSTTLNLMFQYPDIYKTGISIAALTNQFTYDNIYQERYMGVPVDAESRAIYIKGSPLTYAKNLQGNLLYIHGTGDDNVHYNNAEQLLNELIKHNKQIQFMAYPNRSHSLNEGQGTSMHLRTLFTKYLKEHCPPGGR
ncbi:S9 family peptidase [Mucilaginibacter hurinus]|uniref:S9 family peptidase n=1 Tax=Mucilaginibacter hurinus TaxID=2201324 RepID=A0A367GSU4_9SPHI|nr:S9 family peptidase [Mucilaginibacter hurinus]